MLKFLVEKKAHSLTIYKGQEFLLPLWQHHKERHVTVGTFGCLASIKIHQNSFLSLSK